MSTVTPIMPGMPGRRARFALDGVGDLPAWLRLLADQLDAGLVDNDALVRELDALRAAIATTEAPGR